MVLLCTMETTIIPRPPALPPVPGFNSSNPPPPPLPKPNHSKPPEVPSKPPTVPPPPKPPNIIGTNPKESVSKTPPPQPPKTSCSPSKIPQDSSKFHDYSSVKSSKSTSSNGFRLVDDNCDAGSVYSAYKQKIDQMFDSDTSLNTKNSAQARIDKIFTEVPKDSKMEEDSIGVHGFTVDYLGSVPLNDKVTSLAGLQGPLKDLYFAYKKITKPRKMLTGRLEISSQGLRVQYQGERGDLEQMNSFPTIAVWSAVKFVINDHDSSRISYAFLPLITDPDNIDKRTLFRNLDANEEKYINVDAHSPLFAVVMRKFGVHKQLECHGFVCQTSEDAIVIAATLYKSLMSQMKAKEKKPKNRNGVTCMSIASSVYNENNNTGPPVRPPRRKRSTTSSIISDTDIANLDQSSDTQPLLQSSSKKIPKKSTKTRKAPRAPPTKEEDLDAITPYEEPSKVSDGQDQSEKPVSSSNDLEEFKEIKPPTFTDKISTFMSREQKQITAEIKQMMGSNSDSQTGLKRLQSLRRRNNEGLRKKEHSGDILTKVTIPRSGSFLNAGGLTRYKSKVTRTPFCRANGQASGGSPLGFNELFNEFRQHEGLNSMDEILGVIIDSNGMSFNDLKPIYKEFLLKLSVTLTKDELYQRSKSIMRRQKKKILKKTQVKSHSLKIRGKFRRLKFILRRNFKLRLCKRSKKQKLNVENVQGKLPESTISSSSYDTRQFTPKEEAQVAKKQVQKKKSHDLRSKRERLSTSEESDFLSVRRPKVQGGALNVNQHRNSSSGYVSCSDCSYDSDSCTCTSADKCYCSLGDKQFNKTKCKPKHLTIQGENCNCLNDTLTFCGCDTDSCTESNKCYCPRPQKITPILEQLKQKGIMPQNEKHKKLCKKNSHTKSSKSLEYMHNPCDTYYNRLKTLSRPIDPYYSYNKCSRGTTRGQTYSENVQYDLFSNYEDFRKYRGAGMFPRALSESDNVGLLRQSSSKAYRTSKYGSNRREKTLQATTIAASASCHEALSVKKTAEIAALFADLKLNQSTDLRHLDRLERSLNPVLVSHNMYNSFKSHGSVPCRNLTYAHQDKMIQNSLYSSGRNFYKSPNHQQLFNSKNGLYTIQSQSDDSRRSSVGNRKETRDFYDGGHHYHAVEGDINGLENSLGYLP
ncbi:uncharacterized protein LOC123320383 isoform X2 [Coccinella septempunctata]|uniref:uncharacterized protein LOC123320383 isoform X2 n=1 Tax=Coccinella septempunctata TaxID=41139 RepID=UPI001D0653BB|nr:uncharacterized protein LOC123320383 isoform X2 [Coccinella septempunctata]